MKGRLEVRMLQTVEVSRLWGLLLDATGPEWSAYYAEGVVSTCVTRIVLSAIKWFLLRWTHDKPMLVLTNQV